MNAGFKYFGIQSGPIVPPGIGDVLSVLLVGFLLPAQYAEKHVFMRPGLENQHRADVDYLLLYSSLACIHLALLPWPRVCFYLATGKQRARSHLYYRAVYFGFHPSRHVSVLSLTL